MITRTASARYEGFGKNGRGHVSTESGALDDQPYGFGSRFEAESGTNPEELIAAAHAGCFSMAFSNMLAKAGTPPTKLVTSADVSFQPGEGITGIHLTVEGTVPGIDNDTFVATAEEAKVGCPVSQALTGTTITLSAKLA